MISEDALRIALESALGHSLGDFELRPISGGCINDAFSLSVDAQRFFVKGNDHALERQFEAEALGLRAMRDSGTSLVIPNPIAFSDAGDGARFLVTEFVEPGRRVSDFEERLGRGLAEMHACADHRGFGFEIDGYCGATPQPNTWSASWLEFYGTRRLQHQHELAKRRGLSRSDADLLQTLINNLGDWISDESESSLIHGDLWSGNLHVSSDGLPALIDPAAYFGHPEAELGMMALFGGFGSKVWDSYAEARRLRPGWRNRLDLYTLYHVLNHFNLFGGGYGGQAMQIVRRFVG